MNNVQLIQKTIFLKTKTLILGDVHIGLESSMNKNGVLIPRFQFNDLKKETEELLKKLKPKKVVINGDVKHNFGSVSKEEWKQTIEYINLITKYCEIIILEGNHDKLLKIIAEKKEIELKEYYYEEGIYVVHGDKIPKDEEFKKAKTIIIGHEHPSISLRMGTRQETYKCFLKGEYESKELIVMPSMHELSEGTDVLKEKLISPFLKKGVKHFHVYIVDQEPRYFGKVGDLINL